ncbi:hypothetical protein Slala01_71690 [Streptomyces lavendulae subsp. lavendulae]|nr:hypothetical protein Slala01_71690 [Streptomyces lavendulae subsp. lavendulae]
MEAFAVVVVATTAPASATTPTATLDTVLRSFIPISSAPCSLRSAFAEHLHSAVEAGSGHQSSDCS